MKFRRRADARRDDYLELIHRVPLRVDCILLLTAALLFANTTAFADLATDIKAEYDHLTPALAEAGRLIVQGRLDEANAKLLATFPESSRTPAQNFLLANILFKIDPKSSYTLHKRAAESLPNESDPQLEWAMEQHRAREYAGAADSYAVYSKSHPTFGPALGLRAECLLRLGKIQEAVDVWQASENAPDGTLEQFESFVCDVNAHSFPERDRADLLAKVDNGDIVAAQKLIALDAAFPVDWWNNGPNAGYLQPDLDRLHKTKFKDPAPLEEILCAGECALARDDSPEKIPDILKAHNFLLPPANRLPTAGVNLSTMLSAAFKARALSRADARTQWGDAILDKAKSSLDPELFNVAANLYLKTDKLSEIDQLAWDTTNDPRFADSYLLILESQDKLTPTDPRLLKALKQFPEDANIAGILVRLTLKAHQPLQPVLIEVVKAEYTHFSISTVGVDSLRPSANTLATYFKLLATELIKK